MRAAVAGARSVHVRGWMAEECEQAAVEQAWRAGATTWHEAWRAGRTAALDELRRLTGHRRAIRMDLVPWPAFDIAVHDPGFAAVEAAVLADQLLCSQPDRVRRMVAMVMEGATWREAAAAEGVHPSRATQVMRRARRRIG